MSGGLFGGSDSVDGLMVGRWEREIREKRGFIYLGHGYNP